MSNTLLEDLGVVASSIEIPSDLAAKAQKIPILGALFEPPPTPGTPITGSSTAVVGGAAAPRKFLGLPYWVWALLLVLFAVGLWLFRGRRRA